MRTAAVAVAAFVLASSPARAQGDLWLDELPGDLVNVQLDDSVVSKGCTYTAGSAEDPAEFGPPTYVALLAVEPARDSAECPTGYVLLGESTIRPDTEIVAKRGAVVVAFDDKDSFSGAGFIRSTIVHVSGATGEIVHTATLGALPPFGTGTAFVDDLQLRGATLVVRGTKNGVIPGEEGSGSRFVAIYRGFLDDPNPTPVPTSVTAF